MVHFSDLEAHHKYTYIYKNPENISRQSFHLECGQLYFSLHNIFLFCRNQAKKYNKLRKK